VAVCTTLSLPGRCPCASTAWSALATRARAQEPLTDLRVSSRSAGACSLKLRTWFGGLLRVKVAEPCQYAAQRAACVQSARPVLSEARVKFAALCAALQPLTFTRAWLDVLGRFRFMARAAA
jgi:hypothetical protein